MPLYPDRVSTALQAKAGAFHNSHQLSQADLHTLSDALSAFQAMSRAEIESLIAEFDRPGARPTDEQDTQPFNIPFGNEWEHHQAAREWAARVLTGVTTFAVDGSQIAPSKDLSIPVGMIQIGWFKNPHDMNQIYVKDIDVQILSPQEFADGDFASGDEEVEWHRFRGEVERILDFMDEYSGTDAIAFLDGSMVVSFVGTLRVSRQKQYIQLMHLLLARSEATRVPVVGFVDTSYAADVTKLLSHIAGYSGTRISDATLIDRGMKWGDRCRTYVCSRSDGLLDNSFYERIAFTYLKTTRDNPPSRVEMPLWVVNENRHEWVMNVVRADCIVGIGYPYSLQAADAVAVLSVQDRERFYQVFQQFADELALPLRFSRKSVSKRQRRV